MHSDHKQLFLAGSTGLAGTGILKYLLATCPAVRIRAAWLSLAPFVRDRRISYVRGDLRNFKDCCRMLKGCDSAIMAAARSEGIQGTIAEPWRQVNDNVVMNTQFLAACATVGVKRIVVVGSATLYQEHGAPIREDQLDWNKDPHPAYKGVGWVMRFTEKLSEFWHEQAGLEIILARCANIFGPYAKFDPKVSNFIPAIIRKSVDKQDPFEVWGNPDVTRDVIYVDDFARAVVAMMEHRDIVFDCFNIGTGAPTRVGDVVQWALASAGHSPHRIEYRSDRPMTLNYRVLDCSKIFSKLNWKPEVSVKEAIGRTTLWWAENRRHWHK